MSSRKTTFKQFYRYHYFMVLYQKTSRIVVFLFHRFISLTVYWVYLLCWINSRIVVFLFHRLISLTVYWVYLLCWISVWSLNHWTVSSKLQSEGGTQLQDYNQNKIKNVCKFFFFNYGSLWNWLYSSFIWLVLPYVSSSQQIWPINWPTVLPTL